MSVGGYDENATPAEYFAFSLLEDGSYSVRARNVLNMPEDVILPSTYNGKAVTQIAELAFFNMSQFTPCDTIKSVVIPNTVTYIGKAAFWQCSNLFNITFPDSVKEMGCNPHPFAMTAFRENAENWTDDVLYIGNHLLEAKDSISGKYTIKDGTVGITGFAFHDCDNITDIIMPDSVENIGEYAFNSCGKLRNINISNKTTTIGLGAFDYCDSITHLHIPASVVSTGKDVANNYGSIITCEATEKPSGWADDWCNEYQTVVWGYNIEELFTFTEQADGTYSVKAKDVSNLPSEIGIPSSYNGEAVTTIGANAFEECNNLTKIYIPDSVTTIESYAFSGCRTLPTITIPSSVETMEHYVFFNCHALTINCEAASQPSGWSSGYFDGTTISKEWNPDNRPVVWGYTG